MDKKIHSVIQTVLEESGSRYFYKEHDDRYYIGCRFSAVDDTLIVTTLIEAMRDNQALLAMSEDDYRWEGASVISFQSKANAALFYLFMPH